MQLCTATESLRTAQANKTSRNDMRSVAAEANTLVSQYPLGAHFSQALVKPLRVRGSGPWNAAKRKARS